MGIHANYLAQVGSPEWLDQQDKMDKFNLQAHQSAQSHTDEYVVESIVSSAKVSLLLHELLVIEVLPLLARKVVARFDLIPCSVRQSVSHISISYASPPANLD